MTLESQESTVINNNMLLSGNSLTQNVVPGDFEMNWLHALLRTKFVHPQ